MGRRSRRSGASGPGISRPGAGSTTRVVTALALAALVACTASSPTPPATPAPETASPEPPASLPAGFSGERAYDHLEALVEIGPRVSGTPGGDGARDLLRAALAELGVELRQQQTEDESGVTYTNLVAVIPGESPDLVVLAAPYDSQPFTSFRFLGANDGASGAALLLELTRVLIARPLPYTTWVVFVDGDAPRSPETPEVDALVGSHLLVRSLAETGELARVRLALYLNRVADRDLGIARDLRSHRQYRNDFFEAARRLGHPEAFPATAPFDSPVAGHLAFLGAGVRRVVALLDDRFGPGEPPGALRHTEKDDLENCSAESLATVGTVVDAGLRTLTTRLRRIDRFTTRPAPSAPRVDDETPSGVGNETPVTPPAPVRSEDAGASRPDSPFDEGASGAGSSGESPTSS